jgi:hypothetical protein
MVCAPHHNGVCFEIRYQRPGTGDSKALRRNGCARPASGPAPSRRQQRDDLASFQLIEPYPVTARQETIAG